MNSRRTPRHLLAAILIGVLVGGGLMAVTPAGAEVAQVATSWKKIWKKKLQPQADKRYYKKTTADERFAARSALADFYTKADADARYQPKGSYAAAGSSYLKAEADGRFVSRLGLRQGAYFIGGSSTGAGDWLTDKLSFGVTLAEAPTPHFIPAGGALPADCLGTPAAPDAKPGHLCVFETARSNLGAPAIFTIFGGLGASPMGALMTGSTTGAGNAYSVGSWAVRPGAVAPGSAASGGSAKGDFGAR